MNKVVVLLSGGMDSTTLLYHYVKKGDEVRALGIDYGQRHGKELVAASVIAKSIGVPFQAVDLHGLACVLPGSSQTDLSVPVPKGKYDEDSMKATVVPNRNMILLAIAFGHAIAHSMDQVAYAAHAGDHAIYPDCRPEFADWVSIGPSTGLCDWKCVQLVRPFIRMTKTDIVKEGNQLGVPFSLTWSCYEGADEHCGRCGTCIERREAFYLAGVCDPTAYGVNAPSIAQLVRNDWHLV